MRTMCPLLSPFPGVYKDDVPVPRPPFCIRMMCPLLSKYAEDVELIFAAQE
jgi:hypothetical protein